jgi:hypothetical protein
MTNGAGGPHSLKGGKTAVRKGQAKKTKASVKRKGWVPVTTSRGKNQ